jgi:hypothetical protein
MTSKEFVVWMRGFVEACNDYSPTPKQWDTLKGKLAEVSDEPLIGTAIGGWGTPNSAPIQTIPFIQPYPSDPYNPYKITCGTTGESGTTLTVSSGSSGTITYNPSTTTRWYPSGSNWSYTSTLPQQPTNTKELFENWDKDNQLELEFEAK